LVRTGKYNCPYLEEKSNQGKVHPLCKEQRMILWKLPMPFVTRKHNQRSVKSCHKNCFSPLEDGRYFEAPRLCKLYHFILGMIMFLPAVASSGYKNE
jgi:hypothetical protein